MASPSDLAEPAAGAASQAEGARESAVPAAAELAQQAAAAVEQAGHHGLIGIAVVAFVALLCGLGMERLRQPAIVGYILAGAVLGPAGLRLVQSEAAIDVLAEMGVLMLLFIIGMELSIRAFKRIWKIAFITTMGQIGGAILVMLAASQLFDWSIELAIFLGFVVALSSTAVAIKILEDIGELRTRTGQIAVGVLIAQDLAVVPMMLIVGSMGGDGIDWSVVPKVAISVGLLAALIWFLGRRDKIHLPFGAMVAGHKDLKPLAALALCFGCATIAGLFELSPAYGAFIAGLVIGASHERHEMLEATLPIQSILMMVFFVSVGLLIDVFYVWEHLGEVVTLLLMIAVFKTALNVGFIRLTGQRWREAFLSGVVMAQVGEFSFLLSVIGVQSGVIGGEESRLVVSVTVLSLALSPLWVITARRLRTLAAYGITSGSDFLRMVYGPETEAISRAFGKASTRSQRFLRFAAIVLRRRRSRSRRAKARRDTGTRAGDDAQAPRPSPPSEAADA